MIKLLSGDCRDVLATLPADSVQCVVTSPPYYALRSYLDAAHQDKHREIGSERSPDEYLATMVGVFREIRRVMRPDATLWCNMGDSYQDKQLLMMSARLALALQADGWWLRSDNIWHKPNPMPESCTDRPTSAHEHVFLLTKRARYFYDADAVREAHEEPWRSTGRIEDRGSKDVVAGINGGFGLDGRRPREYNPAGRNLRNVWTLPTHPYIHAHFATYPPALAERCIRAGTSERGCCAQCGKPWVRETERNLENVPTRMATKRAPVDCEAMAAYLRERREALGLSRVAVDTALGTRTLYSWFEGRPAGIEPPTPEQWTKLKDVLALDTRFDEQIYGTVEVEITDHSPSKAPGVRTYAKAWNAETTTTGWAPSCDHNADVVPCVVLDPFAGAGTTLLVADRLQRDAIGIELNVAYTEMAMQRCRDDAPLFTSFPPAEPPEDERMRDLFAVAAD